MFTFQTPLEINKIRHNINSHKFEDEFARGQKSKGKSIPFYLMFQANYYTYKCYNVLH